MTKAEYNLAYYAKNKERIALQMKQYRLNNLERLRQYDLNRYPARREIMLAQKKARWPLVKAARKVYCHARYIANKSLYQKKSKAWRKKNIKTILQKNYSYVKANRDKANRWQKNWKLKNPGKVTAYDAQRRALELNAKTDKVAVDKFYVWVRSQPFIPCHYCGAQLTGRQIEVDHIVPLSRGGDHLPSNFNIACRSCNSSKRAKLLSEWRN